MSNALSELKEHYKDVSDNFMAMLSDFNYADEMELLGISKFNFIQRKNLTHEFEVLYIALWFNCLQKSFPQDYQNIFDFFLVHNLPNKYKEPKLHQVIEQIKNYIELLGDTASKDLTPIAQHILSFLKYDESKERSYTLKVTLHIRNVYKFIFERLI